MDFESTDTVKARGRYRYLLASAQELPEKELERLYEDLSKIIVEHIERSKEGEAIDL